MNVDRTQTANFAFREVLQSIFRHMRKMIIVFMVVASAVTAWTLLSTEIYQSEARVIVRAGREYLPLDPKVTDSILPTPEFFEIVNAERSVITSQYVSERVVNSLSPEMVLKGASPGWVSSAVTWVGLGKKDSKAPEDVALERIDKAMRKIALGLDVTSEGSTILLSFDSDDPQRAQTILDTVMSEYLARHIEIFESKASPEFLRGRLGELAQELEHAEAQLADYRKTNELAGLESEKQGLIETINVLESEINNKRALENSSKEQLAYLQKAIENRSERVELSRVSGTVDRVSDFLRQRLIELRLKEKEFEALYADSYRPLVDLRTQIENVDETIAKEKLRDQQTTVGLDQNYADLRAKIDTARTDLAGHAAMRKTKELELVGLRERLRTMAGHELAMSRLRRNVMTSEQAYLEYKGNMTHAEANAALDHAQLSNVVVAQEATRPIRPIKPRKTRNIALGLFVAMLAAVAFGCFLDYTDDTFKSQTDVEAYLQIPVLATLSEEDFRSCT